MNMSKGLLCRLAGTFFILLGCGQSSQNEDRIAELMAVQVEEEVEQQLAYRRADCKQRVLERARAIVDSIIARELRDLRNDSLPRPQRLIRPDKPPIKSPSDTLSPTPLWPLDSL